MIPIDALQLEVTNKCQLDCAECPRRLMSRPIGDMDFNLAKLVTREALEANPKTTLVINGLGDPILYPMIVEYFRFAAETAPDCMIHFFTNLSIPPDKVRLIFKAMIGLQANFLVATTKHLYDGQGNRSVPVSRFYDDALKVAAEVSKDYPKIDLHSHMVITKFHARENIDHFFNQFRAILPDEKVHISQQLNPWFDLVTHLSGQCGADPGQLTRPKDGLETCHYPFKTAHLGWDGEMIICCTDDVDQECTFGKVQGPGDLMRLWNSDKLNDIRARFNRLFDDNLSNAPKPCNKCFRLNWLRNRH